MQVSNIDNTHFSARIKINKPALSYYRDASIISGLGSSSTASGIMSSMPASEPVHHIHSAAKIIDGLFAFCGTVMTCVGAGYEKLAHSLFKEGNKVAKLNK